MKKLTLFILAIMVLLAGCVTSSKNPNKKRSPERQAYEACKKRNNGDTSKCQKEKDDLLERQEIELMDEAS
jgi:starvation-inducible outer membrane lipoprotein